VLAHPHDVRLAAGVEPRVEVRRGTETLVDSADPRHLARESDAGDILRLPGGLECLQDRPVRRRLDLGEVLLDAARRGIPKLYLLEGLADDAPRLVDDGCLRPHRAEVAADEDGHR
jgi:hypothetical protein